MHTRGLVTRRTRQGVGDGWLRAYGLENGLGDSLEGYLMILALPTISSCFAILHFSGGGGGIRTRDTVSRIHTFQACAFSRSATPPSRRRARHRAAEVRANFTGAESSYVSGIAAARPLNFR